MLVMLLLLNLQYFVVVFLSLGCLQKLCFSKKYWFWSLECLHKFCFSKKILFLVFWDVCKNSVSAKKYYFFVFGMFAQVLLQQKMTAIPANLKSEMGMGEDEDLAK